MSVPARNPPDLLDLIDHVMDKGIIVDTGEDIVRTEVESEPSGSSGVPAPATVDAEIEPRQWPAPRPERT
jgi:hypothetical protein